MKKPDVPLREFSYNGLLAETPLPELLYTIGQYKVPGVLACSHGKTVKQIYVRDGKIIWAESTYQEDHLGEFLFRCGKLTREQFDRCISIYHKSKDKRLGQILVEMRILPASELGWAIRSHQQAIVWSLFNWFEGQTKFRLGEFKQDEKMLINLLIPRAILDGVRGIHNAKKIIGFMGNRNTVLEKEENSPLTIEVMGITEEKEREVLKLVDGKTTLYDICARAPYGAHETAKILYGLLVIKLIRRKQEGVRLVSRLTGHAF